VFVLDEIDKLGSDFRGDPSSALLEVLDPEQNSSFSDHYIEVAFDLSRVMFIATANTLSTIPPALLDRMEVIELPGYTEDEKIAIAREHLVPAQLEAHGLSPQRVTVTDAAIDKVVSEYARAGVRSPTAASHAGPQAARRVASQGADPSWRSAAFVSEALGRRRTCRDGQRTALPAPSWDSPTSHGDILFIEATVLPGGEGVRLRLTGQLGEVMRESAEAALSWVRANADALGLAGSPLSAAEIHLHVPAGAVPKDGPSAGIALATALVSALSGRRARGNVAMTGEISLRGRVLPVGGIKDKVLAAARAGIRTVVIPQRNQKDLVDVPDDVKGELEIRLAESIEDVLAIALEPVSG
jgi:ATP-dependent Lon protease